MMYALLIFLIMLLPTDLTVSPRDLLKGSRIGVGLLEKSLNDVV